MTCPNCGSSEYRDFIRGYFKCAYCGIAYLPGHKDTEIEAYYKSGDYRKRFRQIDEAKHQARRANHIIKYIKEPGVFIDIGCSMGALLDLVQGEKYGVDIDPLLTNGAYGKLADVPVQADCISLIHVLEHIPHPADMLREVYGKLNPGGRVVIEVPNYISSYSFPHVVMFDDEALSWTMQAAGFEIDEMFLHGQGGVLGAKEWYYLLATGHKS